MLRLVAGARRLGLRGRVLDPGRRGRERRLRIHWGSVAELNAAARKLGKTSSTEPMGFAVLRKDVATGAFTCDIYIAQSPDRIDRITTLLGTSCRIASGSRTTLVRTTPAASSAPSRVRVDERPLSRDIHTAWNG